MTTDSPVTATAPAERQYDMRRLSYAGTFTNPFKSGTIRTIEWLTAKVTLLRLIRKFEASGAPFGVPFWPKAIRTMGIDIQTPADEVARIPATGPVVVVANHPHGLVDGMIMAELVARVRGDFKILTRSLLTGIPEVEEFMIPVPFPHEDNARELGLQMRDETMKHLKAGGVIILFPAGKVAMSEGWWGPAVEGEWNVFTHKIVRSSGATILPIDCCRSHRVSGPAPSTSARAAAKLSCQPTSKIARGSRTSVAAAASASASISGSSGAGFG